MYYIDWPFQSVLYSYVYTVRFSIRDPEDASEVKFIWNRFNLKFIINGRDKKMLRLCDLGIAFYVLAYRSID